MSACRLLIGDVRETLARLDDQSVQCCVTSPPYWGLRDYDHPDQLGLDDTPEEYVANMVDVFREVRRVLRDDGVLWLNLGDSYAGSWGAQSREHAGKHAPNVSALSANQVRAAARKGSGTGSIPPDSGLKPKDLVGIPWRVAFALQADGWWLRSDVIWAKPNPMPESVADRPTKAHEYVFLLTKSERYFYDADGIAEPLATDPNENYPARAKVTGRGTQGAADARGNDRDKSGGFPPRKRSGNKKRKPGSARGCPGGTGSNVCGSVPWEDDGSGTRNARSVWTITTKPYSAAHFAVFPPELAEKCILAGSAPGDTVLDPFGGSGTTGMVATGHGRDAILCELNPEYAELIRERVGPMFLTVDDAA